jgi:hypothetical protein
MKWLVLINMSYLSFNEVWVMFMMSFSQPGELDTW